MNDAGSNRVSESDRPQNADVAPIAEAKGPTSRYRKP